MIISDEQVQRVVEYLQTSDAYQIAAPSCVFDYSSSQIVDRVVESLRDVPEVRADRVEQARAMLAEQMPSAEVVAAKLIGRVLSDSLR